MRLWVDRGADRPRVAGPSPARARPRLLLPDARPPMHRLSSEPHPSHPPAGEDPGALRPRVRPATATDAAGLAELRLEFRTSLAPGVEPAAGFLTRCTEWMTAHLPWSDVWRCWIAEEGGAVLGMVWVQFLEKLPNPIREPELHAYLTSFYVRPPARNRGVGSALL